MFHTANAFAVQIISAIINRLILVRPTIGSLEDFTFY